MHQVIVTIAPDGTTQVKVDGIAGTSCKDITKQLENSLGSTVKDEKTQDFYKQQATVKQQQKLG